MKIDLEQLELKIKENSVNLGKDSILVKEYIRTKDKINLIDFIRDNCLTEEIINQPKLDALFNALIIINYTNIEFESREIEDLMKLYDYFEINNYMTLIINAIPKVEYNALIGYLEETVDDYNKFKASILGAIEGIMAIAPALMERVLEISKEINVEDLDVINKIYSKFK